MHSLTICFGPTGTVWNLLFKEEAKAKEAYAAIGKSDVTDDFGQTIGTSLNAIHGILLEDLDVSQVAQVERGLHQARGQAKAQTRAMEDPIIKESLRRQQMGPAVMSPVPGGRFNG